MLLPTPHDWRFDEIAKKDPDPKRAKVLEAGIAPSELTSRLSTSMVDAIKNRTARYGSDSKDTEVIPPMSAP
jgi:hypothetical protein